MADDQKIIYQSLERLAQANIDISAQVNAVIAEKIPAMHHEMIHMDDRMRGRMLDQIYNLLLGDVPEHYLAFETVTHQGYGANLGQYQKLLHHIKSIISKELAESWSSVEEMAWDTRINEIVDDIASILQEIEAG